MPAVAQLRPRSRSSGSRARRRRAPSSGAGSPARRRRGSRRARGTPRRRRRARSGCRTPSRGAAPTRCPGRGCAVTSSGTSPASTAPSASSSRSRVGPLLRLRRRRASRGSSCALISAARSIAICLARVPGDLSLSPNAAGPSVERDHRHGHDHRLVDGVAARLGDHRLAARRARPARARCGSS